MRNEPKWLTDLFLRNVNAELVSEFGGLHGPCKEHLLLSAIEKPHNLFMYEAPDLFDLAAAYGFGLAKNHPFSDGNKRIAFVAMCTFLIKNNWSLVVSKDAAIATMLGVADGSIDTNNLAAWLRKNSISFTE